MSIIKSYSVGNGDMFYIDHNSDNFTVIDCCITGENKDSILDEIADLVKDKGVVRFISTHPDDDHIRGLELLDDKLDLRNFYCVKNAAIKSDETDSFNKYCELRDSNKAFYISKGCNRKWMNCSDDQRKSAGINILWPNRNNEYFKGALKDTNDGGSPNNISPIIKYSTTNGPTLLWMGDLETAFLEAVEDQLVLPKVNIVFAPHHGRESGRIPDSILEKIAPDIVVVGEAPSENIHYYPNHNTITQNTAGDILFDCRAGKVHVFTSNEYEAGFLVDESKECDGYFYIGTLNI